MVCDGGPGRGGLGRWIGRGGAAALPVLLLAAWLAGQALGKGDDGGRLGEFDLFRLQYDSVGGPQEAYYYAYGKLWQRWETDYPDAEQNFSKRLKELTRVVPGRSGVGVRLTDPNVFQYPFLFVSDPGWMELSDKEAGLFREYLQRGGFMWVDDFWGDAEWSNFEREMAKVLPGTQWREIPRDHPVLHTVFDLSEAPMIPARDFADDENGREPAGLHKPPVGAMEPAHLRGYFGPDDRLLVVATHNTDLGDGFEREAYGQFFFEHYSTRAYALGVNIVVYALTH